MRRTTIGAILLTSIFLIGLLTLPQAQGALGGEGVERSMIMTETGDETFFVDKAEGSLFIVDLFFDKEKTTTVKLMVVNPDADTEHDINISLEDPEAADWEFRIVKVVDEAGEELPEDDEVIEGERFVARGVDGGRHVMVTLEATYTGESDDASQDVTVSASIQDTKTFSAAKTLSFETYATQTNFILIFILGFGAAVLGLVFAFFTARKVKKAEVGSEELKKISGYIKEGAIAFLNSEYKILAFFIVGVVVFLLIGAFTLGMDWKLVPAFLLGAGFSALAGNIGMRIATSANAKTAWACKDSKRKGLKVAFNSGAVMGMTVVGLGLLGVSSLFIIFGNVNMLFGFGFGASSIALFARVGGGIYTKAADVGADLVGKVEKGIPEDDPRNPATIADNVGDNVGDVAGMGADLFESYVDSVIAAMALGIVGIAALDSDLIGGGMVGIATILPLLLAGIGIISAVIGTFFVGMGGEKSNPQTQMNMGVWIAAIVMAVLSLILIWFVFDDMKTKVALFFSLVVGLVAGIVIGKITEYYTSADNKPTRKVAEAATTGAGPNIIRGLGLGMLSTAIPVVAVVFTIVIAFILSGQYGIALAAVGMLSTLGITLATDTYGPVADNAAGLAEMGGMGKKVRETAEELDAVGNTTAAIGKGFAIGSAALTALALFISFTQTAGLDVSEFNLINPYIVSGLFIGGLLPFVFCALAMLAVGAAAQDMVEEVRRQFKTIKGLMEGKAKPDYQRCVAISTKGALKKMIVPAMIAVVVPIVVGCISLEALGGLLAGSIVTGFVVAVMMANSGGAWDNAKKYIEGGNFGGKGSDAHKAAVIGDTVGDPFKDTAGPSLNILIKLMSIVSIVFVPLFILINNLIG